MVCSLVGLKIGLVQLSGGSQMLIFSLDQGLCFFLLQFFGDSFDRFIVRNASEGCWTSTKLSLWSSCEKTHSRFCLFHYTQDVMIL